MTINKANHALNLNSSALTQYLETVVDQETTQFRLVDVSIIPDNSKLLELETERIKLFSTYNAYNYKKPKFSFLAGKATKDSEAFETKLKAIENDIILQRQLPTQGSNYAFFALNSVEAAGQFDKFVA